MGNVRSFHVSSDRMTGGYRVCDGRGKPLPEFAPWAEDGEGEIAEFDLPRAKRSIRDACAEAYSAQDAAKAEDAAGRAAGNLLPGLSDERAGGILPLNGKVPRNSLMAIAAKGRVVPNSETRARIALSLLMEAGGRGAPMQAWWVSVKMSDYMVFFLAVSALLAASAIVLLSLSSLRDECRESPSCFVATADGVRLYEAKHEAKNAEVPR